MFQCWKNLGFSGVAPCLKILCRDSLTKVCHRLGLGVGGIGGELDWDVERDNQ